VSILGAFTADDPELGVTDISERLGLHKSTVHRFLVNLEAAGLLERNTRNGRYRLGLRLFELGGLVLQQMNLWDEALPFLEQLVRESGETGQLAVLDQGEAIYIERVEARRALRVPAAMGRGYPAHATSHGKLLLAYQPPESVLASVSRATRSTARNTKRDFAALVPLSSTTPAMRLPRLASGVLSHE
jgi:IclR family transcriptional regulator, KDG regulon repressor